MYMHTRRPGKWHALGCEQLTRSRKWLQVVASGCRLRAVGCLTQFAPAKCRGGSTCYHFIPKN